MSLYRGMARGSDLYKIMSPEEKRAERKNRQDKRGFDFIREVSRRGVMYHVFRSR